MTKKDYELIAEAINELSTKPIKGIPDDAFADGVRAVAEHLAVALNRDNPRFDKDRFMEACGL